MSQVKEVAKMTRMYGLFEKIDGRWVRVPRTGAYPKPAAVRIFQGLLLAYIFGAAQYERSLRPIPHGAK